MDGWMDGQTDRQIDRQTDRQKGVMSTKQEEGGEKEAIRVRA